MAQTIRYPSKNHWALVLAAGEGSRLRALTTKPCGTAVPKQFCSLNGGQTLLEDSISRASGLIPRERICAIVAQQHRDFWGEQLAAMPERNLIVQPRNRGTAIGILYPLLHIARRDPNARVLVLPADHHVRDEQLLRRAMHGALQSAEADPKSPVLVGIEPDHADPELGYILPGLHDARGMQTVARFVEKPRLGLASEIIGNGGLWNSFIMAASVQTLIDMFMVRFAPIVMEMQVRVRRSLEAPGTASAWSAISDMYEQFPTLDFSKDVLEHSAAVLRVVKAPQCGWSDLGTPVRVAETLRTLTALPQVRFEKVSLAHINLAVQHALMLQREPAVAGA